jgi:hypothetical protein
VASNELVRLTITAAGRIWRSAYESIDTVDHAVEGEKLAVALVMCRDEINLGKDAKVKLR